MISNILKWVFKVGENEAHLLFENGTSIEVLKEVAYQITKYCGLFEENQKQQKASQDASKSESDKVEEIKQPPQAVE